MSSGVQHTMKYNVTPVLNVPLILNKGTLIILKKRIGSIRFTIVMGNHELSVIWKILNLLKTLMIAFYLVFYYLMLAKNL